MAASVIGSIYVNLGLNTAQFSQELSGVRASLAKIGPQMMKTGGIITAALTGAFTGVTLAMRGTLNAADEMAKASQKFGVPIDELSRLKHAADLSGISFEGLGTGLRRLSQNMNDASQGIGEGQAAFEQLGLTVTNADGSLKSSTEILNEMANAFAGMPDGAAKTAAAMDLMGRSGADLIPLLNGGAAGLQAMKDEADALGIVFTEETAKAAEQFNDNITRLTRVFDGLKTQLAAELAPVLADFTDWLVENGPAIVAWAKDMAQWFRDLSPETKKWGVIIAAVGVAVGPVLIVLGALATAIAAVGAPVAAVIAAIGLLVTAVVAFRDEIEAAVNGAIAAVQKFQTDLVAAFSGSSEAMVEIGKSIMSGLESGMRLGMGGPIGLAGAVGKSLAQRAAEALGIQSPSKVFEEIGRDTMLGFEIGIRGGSDGVQDAAGEAASGVSEITRGLLDPLKEGLKSGKLEFESFADAVVNIANRMADRMIDEAFGKIEDALSGAFSGGGGGGGIFGTIIGGIIGAFGGGSFIGPGVNISSLGFANGGFIPRGRFGLVGEAGPEFVRGPAHVTSAADTAAMMGGAGIVQNNYFEGVNHATRAMLEGMLAQSEARILRAVPDTAAAGFRQRPGLRR